ncbi:hypothetical protein BDV59DRAFT_194421 [Aspergillus ambiguus]|uniref:uncharacterized protein n=1 Tax=Aspergillus ambiguus TaxID=176160 RepID=UPI003CCD0457
MSPSSAALSLRESFGDRRIPDISRKITACVACRKLKTKCHMNDGKPPCSRCKTRSLTCTVNKSLQMLLESDASWKESMEKRMENLEKSLGTLHPRSSVSSNVELSDSHVSRLAPSAPFTLNLSCSLGAFPASSILNVTLNADRGVHIGQDLISCRVISHDIAEGLFTFYQQKLDPCVHHIIAKNDNLATMRSRSSLLTSAICTVASFCTGAEHYQDCFNFFTKEVSGKLFFSNYTFDDVRALCIGAFWLNEISSALNGLAVRIGAELDLHRCITKMPHGKLACYDRTRLYFLLYLCDHHCSLSHGRPPLTRDFHSLKNPRDFLQSKFSTRSDVNLISQIELWSINSRVFDGFGADTENAIATERSAELERLSAVYDRWYHEWLHTVSFDYIKEHAFLYKMFELYAHSAKLYLFSHVFRGLTQDAELSIELSKQGVYKYAQNGMESALSIIRCIVDDESEPKLWLARLPLYFGTMTAFASRVITNINPDEIRGYLRRLIQILQSSLELEHSTHPFLSIARSLELAAIGQLCADHGDPNYNENEPSEFSFDSFTNDGLNMGLFRDSDDWISMLGL